MKDNVTKDNGQIHQNVYDVLVMHTMYDIIEDLDEQDKPLFLAEEILVRLFRVVHICTRSRSILAGEDKYTLPKAYLASEHQDLIDRLLLVQPYETSASSVDQARINSSLQYDDPNGHTWGTFLKSVTTDATKNTLHVEALRDICTDKL
jgi:hypothetical protein